MIKIKYLCLVFCLMGSLNVFAVEVIDTIEAAFRNSEQVQSRYLDVKTAEYATQEQASGMKPAVSFSSSLGQLERRSSIRDTIHSSETAATLLVSQLIADGGYLRAAVSAEKARVGMAKSRHYSEVLRVALEAIEVHFDLVKAVRLYRLAQKNVKSHQLFERQMLESIRFDAGRQVELQQARSRLGFAETAQQSRLLALQLAMLRYRTVVGSLPVKHKLSDTLGFNIPVGSMRSNMKRAISKSPLIEESKYEILAAKYDVNSAAASRYPKLTLDASSEYLRIPKEVTARSTDNRILVNLSVDLFDGGQKASERKRLSVGVSASKERAKLLHKEVLEEVARYIHEHENYSTLSDYYNQQFSLLKEISSAYTEQFKIGRRALLDVLNAKGELFIAQSNYYDVFYDAILSKCRIAFARGDLLDLVGFSVMDDGQVVRRTTDG